MAFAAAGAGSPAIRAVTAACAAMAATLAAFGSALLLEHLAHLHVDTVMQAVVLSVTLARSQQDAPRADRLLGFAVLPAVALVSVELGTLMADHAFAGDALFTALVAGAIWLRRFGRRFAGASRLMLLPPMALLVVPHAVPGSSTDRLLWTPVVALLACFWVTAVHLLVQRFGEEERTPPPAPASPARATGRRLAASTRMAAQMATALAAAFASGHLLYPDHWSWVVLTAFIVCSGAQGRGDAVHKGLLRALGAAGGTVVAALVSDTFAPGDQNAVVLIFVILGVAIALRRVNYAYWAGGVTAALSLLYGYFGQAAGPLLRDRLEAILVGAVIGVAAAWLVLPFRTRDVLRRRTALALAALDEVLRGEPDAVGKFERAVAELDRLHGPLSAHRLLKRHVHRDTRPHPADAIDILYGTVAHVRALRPGAPTGALRRNVGLVRRAIGRRADGQAYEPAPIPDGPSAQAIAGIDSAMARLYDIFTPPVPAPVTTTAQGSPESARQAG
ncbi:FUSC family protein [Actinomadura fibrosa]|uniref:FUSC family protein n=1 Tax=Actinomadura fibrosa TaxID=111802 RepID=A0ABW2XKE0_9ACTN|nr:FUSC family protein [Actinomadura fibrosa]